MTTEKKNKLIWDIPTRLFHWLLAIGFGLQWLTGEFLDDFIDWHFYIGYSMLGLVIFRIIWGFIGTQYAQFSQFLSSPRKALRYAKSLHTRQSPVYAGHNPLGGWVVMLMLLLIGLQAISGLFVTDEIFSEGPYYTAVNTSVKDVMAFVHFNLFNLLLVVVGLHITAVFVYQCYKKQNLISAMFNGKKRVTDTAIHSSKILRALLVLALVAIAVYLLVALLPPQSELYF